MSKTRIKRAVALIGTREEAEAVMNELAQAVTQQRELTARRDAEVLRLNEKYEAGLCACAEEQAAKSDALRAWAESNPEQFPKGRKSLEMTSGTLGFRTGTPKLALLSRSWTWAHVLARLQAMGGFFVRTKEEVDKEGILAAQAGQGLRPEELTSMGVRVVQEESFFIEPRLTEVESRQTVAA